MNDCCVHHVEFGVKNGEEFVRRLRNEYNLSLICTRSTKQIQQWVLQSGTACLLITQHKNKGDANFNNDPYHVPWIHDKSTPEVQTISESDSVFNVALKVKDITTILDRVSRSKYDVLKPLHTVSDSHGTVKIAVVRSCIGNVVHTLIDDSDYSGLFLPEFVPASEEAMLAHEKLTTHIDHVTFACECGDSAKVLDWYSNIFGMCRFLINRDEDEDSGFVIDTEDIGLRLKAFEYWKCAETGITSGAHPNSIKFVIAEALPNQGPNQVDTFLRDHQGPGIQHIGLHTEDIIHTVAKLKDNGVQFAEPPYTYYTEVGKLAEIGDIGQDLDILRQNGILVDAEADTGEIIDGVQHDVGQRYLMQKFTKPLFGKNTFFLEIIQRIGAHGFGSGNITALWRSVQAYMNNQEKGATP